MESWNLELETGAWNNQFHFTTFTCQLWKQLVSNRIHDHRLAKGQGWSFWWKIWHGSRLKPKAKVCSYYTNFIHTDTDTDQTLLCSTLHQPCPQRLASESALRELSPETSGAPCKDSTPWIRAPYLYPSISGFLLANQFEILTRLPVIGWILGRASDS